MEKMVFGLTVTAIGMGVVFIELIFLVYVINVISWTSKRMDGKKNAAQVKTVKAESQAEVSAAALDTEKDDEIAAVISAAIAYMTQGSTVIKVIRRLPGANAPAWSGAGRMETMNLRQI
ncbi:MAG: OadG family protein [Peptococcaceae bacterium]|jgi:sodium pump decarboxylase gamma subunit|nr:OadG family protein [Peptococcaceae bacterium]MDH7525600.1 OadG family protein [Peptococcaceae bacterium]